MKRNGELEKWYLMSMCIFFFSGFYNPWSLENRITGDWQRSGSTVFTFKKGIMAAKRTGSVYGTYEVIDSKTIRLKTEAFDSLIEVKFEKPDIMKWYKIRGEFRSLFRVFKRSE